jgi:hypothetical protein
MLGQGARTIRTDDRDGGFTGAVAVRGGFAERHVAEAGDRTPAPPPCTAGRQPATRLPRTAPFSSGQARTPRTGVPTKAGAVAGTSTALPPAAQAYQVSIR